MKKNEAYSDSEILNNKNMMSILFINNFGRTLSQIIFKLNLPASPSAERRGPQWASAGEDELRGVIDRVSGLEPE